MKNPLTTDTPEIRLLKFIVPKPPNLNIKLSVNNCGESIQQKYRCLKSNPLNITMDGRINYQRGHVDYVYSFKIEGRNMKLVSGFEKVDGKKQLFCHTGHTYLRLPEAPHKQEEWIYPLDDHISVKCVARLGTLPVNNGMSEVLLVTRTYEYTREILPGETLSWTECYMANTGLCNKSRVFQQASEKQGESNTPLVGRFTPLF